MILRGKITRISVDGYRGVKIQWPPEFVDLTCNSVYAIELRWLPKGCHRIGCIVDVDTSTSPYTVTKVKK